VRHEQSRILRCKIAYSYDSGKAPNNFYTQVTQERHGVVDATRAMQKARPQTESSTGKKVQKESHILITLPKHPTNASM